MYLCSGIKEDGRPTDNEHSSRQTTIMSELASESVCAYMPTCVSE